MLIEYNAFAKILINFLKENVIKNKDISLEQYIPKDYQALWNLVTQSSMYDQ